MTRWIGLAWMVCVVACGNDVGVTGPGSSSSGGSTGTSTGSTSDTRPTTGDGTGTGTSTTGTSTAGPTTEPDTTSTGPDPTTSSTGDTGSSSDTGGASLCCAPQGDAGCGDRAVEACVCDQDPFCCLDTWDSQCAGEADSFGCTACEFMSALCCAPQRGPGCAADPGLTACVCFTAPECCSGTWDAACAAKVESSGCGSCDGPPIPGPCCEVGEAAACIDDDVATCVCASQPECCSDVWSADCVAAVESLGCGTCGGIGECCTPQDGPGCVDPAVEACVCANDSFCCEEAWDDVCTEDIEMFGCGSCSGMGGDCCAAGTEPGCNDLGVASCVCEAAPSCCQTEWSDACAALVEPLGCGTCGGASTACCEAHDSAGCDDMAVSECVCAVDDFCCTTAWDATCVQEVDTFGCGACP